MQFAWAIILFVGMLFLPETPRYLIRRGQDEKAAQSLSRMRRLPVDYPDIVNELAEVKAAHEFEKSLARGTYIDCFRGHMVKRQLTGMALQGLQQLTGRSVSIATLRWAHLQLGQGHETRCPTLNVVGVSHRLLNMC